MLDIKKILLENGVSEEVASVCTSELKKEIPQHFVSKTQYRKKSDEIDVLNGKIADLEIQVEKGSIDEYKTKYTKLEKEYNEYKQGVETKENNKIKSDTILSKLKKEGAKESVLNLLLKEFNLERIKVENGEVENWESLVKPVKETYSDLFGTTTIVGNPPATPQTGFSDKKFTLDNIKKMSASEIAKNYDKIQKDLKI